MVGVGWSAAPQASQCAQGDRWYRLPELELPQGERAASAYADTGAPENVSVDASFLLGSPAGAVAAVALAGAFWGDSTGSDVHLCMLRQPLEPALPREPAGWRYSTAGLGWPRDAHGRDGPEAGRPLSAPGHCSSMQCACTMLRCLCRPGACHPVMASMRRTQHCALHALLRC